jgi:hypothetical protein
MARTLKTLHEADLERELLRKGVGALVAGRHLCADCGRTPLIGEHMYRFAAHELVCALCRPRRRSAPEAIELVRHFEAGHTVRRIARDRA